MNTLRFNVKRTAASALACLLVWADLSGVAQAVSTDIANIPMATKSRAKPNLIMAVDDSGSMDGEFSPVRGFSTNDGAAWWNTRINSFVGCGYAKEQAGTCAAPATPLGVPQITANDWNFNIQGNTNADWKKYVYLFPNGQCGRNCDTRSYSDARHDHFAIPPTREFAWFRSPLFNAQYYNPAINYDPWRPFNNGSTTTTPPAYDNGGTDRNWNAVRSHPIYSGTTMDLTSNINRSTANWTFRMYPGMVVPAGTRYRSCTTEDNGSCGGSAWVTMGSSDLCYRTVAENCIFGAAFGAAVGNLTIAGSNHLDVQISYWAPTVWVASTGTGALAADEAWGPIVPPATTPTRLKRIEITAAVANYTRYTNRSDCASTTTCTYAEEMQNFANWFGYYRKRHLYLNAATGLAFDQVTGIRVGQFQFNNRFDVSMYDFDSTTDSSNSKRLLYDLYSIKGDGGTPTRPSLEYVGKQFQRTGSGAPINAACQYNGAFVITDGFANDEKAATTYGNVDGSSASRFNIPYDPANPSLRLASEEPPGIGTLPAPPTDTPAVTVTPAAPYPDTWDNTLADIAMYYYQNNLRPDLAKRQVPLDLNDIAPDADRQDYLHMSTYALGLGVQGFIFNRTDSTPLVNSNTNPYQYPPDWNANGDPTTQVRSPTAVDELWHATINGRGAMLSASSPEQARSGVVDVVNSVGAKGGAGAAVAVANPNLSSADNFAYASSYNSGAWSGDINKFTIDLVTGFQSTTPVWNPSPQKQLANRETSPTDTRKRVIFTFDGTVGQPFQWANLTTAQKTALNNDVDILGFLRGNREKEVEKFRSRGPRPDQTTSPPSYPNGITPANISVLGSIINGEPVVIGTPQLRYFDPGYFDYRTTNASRSTVVLQGANDGMMHAFDANSGAENWAYVPSFVYGNLKNLSDRNTFTHRYGVDGTPNFNDVDMAYTDPIPTGAYTPNWKTLLVGSLRKGGFGYFALDVSLSGTGTEATQAGRVLWEFPNALTPTADRLNVGFTYGRPVIVKTRAAGWVVVVSSGYNNGTDPGSSGGDGQGRIWILNARTGAIIRSISTGVVGTASDPSGLAHLSAFVERPDVDALVEAVYGGDLKGNLWRFDLSGTTTASWSVTRLTTLVDSAGNFQPITSEPELGIVSRKRMIYVGTGQYLGDSDVPGATSPNVFATRKMAFYGIKDDLSVPTFPNPVISALRSNLVAQTVSKNATTGQATVTSNTVDLGTKAGWVVDFVDNGERSVTNPVLSGGVLGFTTIIPDQSDLCVPGGSSWLWFLDYATGGKVINSTLPSGSRLGTGLASRLVLVRLPSGKIVALIRRDQKVDKEDFPSNPDAASSRRMSWRELVQ